MAVQRKGIFANTEFHVGSLGHLKGENKIKEGGLKVSAALSLSKTLLYYVPVNSDSRRLSLPSYHGLFLNSS